MKNKDKYRHSKSTLTYKFTGKTEGEREQMDLDIKEKRRKLFWFYPILISGFIATGIAVYSCIKLKDKSDRIESLELEIKSIKASIWVLSRQNKNEK